MLCPVSLCDFPVMSKANLFVHLRAAHDYDRQQIEELKKSFREDAEAARLQKEKAFEEKSYGCLEPDNFVPCAGTSKSYVLRSTLHPGYCIRFSLSGKGTNNTLTWRCYSCISVRTRPFRSHNAYSRDDVWISDPDGGSHVCGWPAEKHKELEVFKNVASSIVKRETKKKAGESNRRAHLSAVMRLSTAPELSRFTEEEIAEIQLHQRLRHKYESSRQYVTEKPRAVEHPHSRTTGERSKSPHPETEMGVSAMDLLLGNVNESTDMETESTYGEEIDYRRDVSEQDRTSHQMKQADDHSTIVLGDTSMTPEISGRSSFDTLQEGLLKEEINICKMKLKREAQELKNEEEFHAMRMRTERIKQEMYLKRMKTDEYL